MECFILTDINRGHNTMKINYDAIKKQNIIKYGQDTEHLDILGGDLYTDNTHFIYELLQNAQDAKAKSISFHLYKDKLEIVNDGIPFDENDVRAICSIAKGTKKNDDATIGRFGIGFKSVYAHTLNPEVHSGGEHFTIKHYVRPEKTSPRELENPKNTLFVLPFNNNDVTQVESYEDIKKSLCSLDLQTLLFLTNIKEIHYYLPDGSRGKYLRKSKKHANSNNTKEVFISQEINNAGIDRTEESATWLVFSENVKFPGVKNNSIDIAFSMDKDNASTSIQKTHTSYLVTYFPTEMETKLGFLINGPYNTNPQRNGIYRNNKFNLHLIKQTAEFLIRILPLLKKNGLLSISLLETLPINSEDFPSGSIFRPFYDAVLECLKEEELLPCDDGTWVGANHAKLARGKASIELLQHKDLKKLCEADKKIKWLSSNITKDSTRELHEYITTDLKVEEIEARGVIEKLSYNFLEGQSDQWLIKLYEFLSRLDALIKRGSRPLYDKPILRLESGKMAVPYKDVECKLPNAFFSADGNKNSSVPIIKLSISKNKLAYNFLYSIGISKPDLIDDIIMNTLNKYEKDNLEEGVVTIKDTEHKKDIQKVFAALDNSDITDNSKELLREQVKDAYIIKAQNTLGEVDFSKPGSVYFDEPDLHTYFGGSPEIYFVDKCYRNFLKEDDYAKFLEDVGVNTVPIKIENINEYRIPDWVERADATKDSEQIIYSSMQGVDDMLSNFNNETEKDELSEGTKTNFNLAKERTLILFKYLNYFLKNDENFLDGCYCWRKNKSYTKKIDSPLKYRLQNTQLIATINQDFKSPADPTLTYENIAPDVKRYSLVMNALGIGNDEFGVELDQDDQLNEYWETNKNDPDFRKSFKVLVTKRKPVFPTEMSVNPEKRAEVTAGSHSNLVAKTYRERTRSVRTSKPQDSDPRYMLKQRYSNEANEMVCQICEDEMPFKKRDGEYYFEAVEAINKSDADKESAAYFLALCPTCAAKYKEFVKKVDKSSQEMQKFILENPRPQDYKVPIKLDDGEASVHFVQTHYIDLQALLRIHQKQSAGE